MSRGLGDVYKRQEILNTFPITFRRMGLKVGLFWVMLAMAAGKVAGSLYYFLGNFKAQ